MPYRRCSSTTNSIALMLPLESRRLLAQVFPNNYEQYLVELINRGRADPAAEATRYGIALNEGVPSDKTISTTAKQPLAINLNLVDAARQHSQWMIDTDTFSHTGQGATNPGTRMTNAGYSFSGSSGWGENIAWNGTTGSLDIVARTAQLHSDLFVDEGYPNRGHRTNLMGSAFREIGAGVVSGVMQGYNAAMGTEDFAYSGTSIFLTGVAYNDNVTQNSFYTPGEGLAGVTVTAKRTSDNATFSTTTWSSGGYSLPLTAGTYTVTGSGGGLGGTVTYGSVVIGSQNVKRDFTPDQAQPETFATLSNGKLTINGSSGSDAIEVTISGATLTAKRNQIPQNFAASAVTSIDVFASDGDDSINLTALSFACYVDAGPGNDVIYGSAGNDVLTGGAGKDKMFGGLGDDRLGGSGGHDLIFGEGGKDRLYGGEQNDTLDGGSSADRLYGEGGNNSLIGQSGDDYLYARNSLFDYVYGGTGIDHAQVDGGDTRGSVEDLLA